jgi:hypothetical protein
MKPITWSILLQSRGAIKLGGNPDMDGVARVAFENGMEEAIIIGKDHTGFCMHPTRFGVMHPSLKINLTKGLADALHKYGIRAIAYVNFGMDGEAGRRHRDWLQEKSPGQPALVTPDHYADLCVFSPYLKEYMLPVVKEILLDCGADGIFFDTMSAFFYCACPVCRAAFKKAFDKELPLADDPEDPAWDLYGPWQYERMCNCLQTVYQHIRDWKPGASVLFNHLGGPAWPFPLPGVVEGMISCDPPAFFPWVSMYASYQSSLPTTGDVFIERFARGWGDRNANTTLTMRYKSAAIFAHRQRFCIGDRIHSDWRLGPGTTEALKTIQAVWRQFNRALPDELLNAPDFLLLHPESYRLGPARKAFQKPGDNRQANGRLAALGSYRLLMDCGRSFMVLPEMALTRQLQPGRVLIIPAAEYVKPETDAVIDAFVAAGGTVLLVERVPRLDDGSLPKWCGFSAVEEDSAGPRVGAVYLPDLGTCRRGKDDERPLLRSNVCKLESAGAEALLYGYPQEHAEFLQKTPYPSFYMASDSTPMDTPLLTCFRYGRGKVWFLNCAMFTDYTDGALPVYKHWMENLLRRIHPRADFELVSPGGDVEIVSYRHPRKRETVHVLLNHGGRRTSLRHLFTSEQVIAPQPAYPVTLRIRSKADLRITVDGKSVEAVRRGASVHVPIVMDSLWKFVKCTEKS